MKPFVAVYFLVAILCSCSQANGFRFGDFFFGNHDTSDTIKRSSEAVKPEDLSNTTIPIFSETELDISISNSSLGEEFVDLALQNSSEGSIVPSQNDSAPSKQEDDKIPKQSVKKQLLPLSSSSTEHPTVHVGEQDVTVPAKNSATSSADGLKVTSSADEMEEVVLGTTKATAIPVVEKSIFQKSIEWVKDTYTLSIVIPVAAGVLFATTCIATIAICSCIRRCCRRRRLRRKILPDSVKSLRASDRKRLLGDCSSDEEF